MFSFRVCEAPICHGCDQQHWSVGVIYLYFYVMLHILVDDILSYLFQFIYYSVSHFICLNESSKAAEFGEIGRWRGHSAIKIEGKLKYDL